MHRLAFQAALRAAAKISFGTALIGCGGTVTFIDSEEETDAEETEYELESPDNAHGYRTPPVDPTEPVCELPAATPDDWSVFDENTFACCVEGLAGTIPADFEQSWNAGELPQATQQCCTQIIAPNYNEIWQGLPLAHPAPEDVVAACCVAAHGNVGCTPWGPPVPPAMLELDLLAFDAQPIDMVQIDLIPWLSPEMSLAGAA